MKKRTASLIVAILFLGLLGTGVAQAAGDYMLRDDATGGDCTKIGNWNFATKTCTLKMDLAAGVTIVSSGITLDGQGHTLTGGGITAGAVSDTTIKNLTIKGESVLTAAIFATGGAGLSVFNCTISNPAGAGIFIPGHFGGGKFRHNVISGNKIGVSLKVSASADISNNIISNNDVGVSLNSLLSGVTLTNNTIQDNSIVGVAIQTDVGPVTIYNNNFIDNALPQIQVYPGQGVVKFEGATGGNYWSDYHTTAQGCTDLNRDGFCDAPYVFPGGQDLLPWTRQNGWFVLDADNLIAEKERACEVGWISKQGICNSLDVKLNAARASIERDSFDTAKNQLNAFIHELDAQKGKAVDEQAYDLLKPKALDLINNLPY
jgi:parallel beta-helix repeat protein